MDPTFGFGARDVGRLRRLLQWYEKQKTKPRGDRRRTAPEGTGVIVTASSAIPAAIISSSTTEDIQPGSGTATFYTVQSSSIFTIELSSTTVKIYNITGSVIPVDVPLIAQRVLGKLFVTVEPCTTPST